MNSKTAKLVKGKDFETGQRIKLKERFLKEGLLTRSERCTGQFICYSSQRPGWAQIMRDESQQSEWWPVKMWKHIK